MSTPEKAPRVECPYCPRAYARNSIRDHVIRRHGEVHESAVNLITCPICRRVKTEKAMRSHVYNAHRSAFDPALSVSKMIEKWDHNHPEQAPPPQPLLVVVAAAPANDPPDDDDGQVAAQLRLSECDPSAFSPVADRPPRDAVACPVCTKRKSYTFQALKSHVRKQHPQWFSSYWTLISKLQGFEVRTANAWKASGKRDAGEDHQSLTRCPDAFARLLPSKSGALVWHITVPPDFPLAPPEDDPQVVPGSSEPGPELPEDSMDCDPPAASS